MKYWPRIILGIIAIIFLSQCDIINAFIGSQFVGIFTNVTNQIASHANDFRYALSFEYKSFKIFYEFIGKSNINKLIHYLAIAVVINIILKGVFVYIQEYTLNSAVYKTLRDIRRILYQKIIKYPMSFYDLNRTGDLMSKITNDVGMIEITFKEFNVKVKELLQSSIFIFWLFYINWKLTMVIIVIFPITGFIMKRFAAPIRKAQQKIVENISHITSFLQETLNGIKIIKIFVREKKEANSFNSLTQSTYVRNMRSVRLVAFQKPINELLSMMGVIAVVLFAGNQLVDGTLIMKKITAYIILLMLAYKPIKGFGRINLALQRGLACGTRIFELMDRDTEKEIYASKKIVDLKKTDGQVEFENVSFEYKSEEQVLKNINFKAMPGEVIAIVGHSGSGKTTIVNLVPLFYKIKQGRILIDNIDIKDIEYMSLRKYIAMVPQETFLFSGTIRDNIAYAVEDASFEEIIEAAKQANAHKFIMKFRNKYDTQVGEKGVQLSGGEKQRISIARAILKDPKILILDEATSALDTKSEMLVQKALNNLMTNRTTFVIAHRLSTIQNADKILVIEEGRIMQKGSHKELIRKKNGLYYKLCNAQKLFK